MGQMAFRVGIYISVMSLVLLFFLRPGSVEFGVTVVTLVIGFIFLGVVMLFVRYFSR